jgi:glycosyltransferase involved in cell wall biosynthesis
MSAAFFARIPHRHHTYTGQIWANSTGLHKFFFKKMDWLIGFLSTVIMADSVSQIKFLIRERVCRPSKIFILGPGSISGVNIDVFKPSTIVRKKLREQFSVSESTCLFLYVGRLSKDKGIDDLLEAYSGIKANHKNIALWVVGPDEEGIAARVKAINPELYSSIEWFGASFNPEIYMASADVLLLPSYREGFGTVIIEAAASSLPTLAYRIDGVVDAVIEGDTGLLASLGDVHDFRNQMDVLYAAPELRTRLGSSAQKRAHTYFSSKYITQIWVEFYLQLIPR